jgi:hypothetical protein
MSAIAITPAMRPLIALLLSVASLIAATAQEPPIRASLDDLRSNAVYLLNESDGVAKVERLVAVDRPKHRIIHIRDWHWVPYDLYVADRRDLEPDVTDDELRAAYDAERAIIRPVRGAQKKLLRWLTKYHGVKRVWVEGLTDADMAIHETLVRVLGGLADAASQLGLDVAPAEDEKAFEAAKPEAFGLVFDGPANAERERAIVRRLLSDELAVVILGGDHDLSEAVPPGVEYLRVTVEGWPGSEGRRPL